MPKLTATSTILEHELSELRLLIERQTGVVLDGTNSALAARLAEYIEAQDLGSAATLLDRVRSSQGDPCTMPSLLEGLVNNNTGFFRHQGALHALRQQVMPQICARKAADGPSPLRIWSAGCSSGEETYSIAIAVCDGLSQIAANHGSTSSPGNGNGKSGARNGGIAESASSATHGAAVSIHIVGSDLLPRNIEVADRGIYPQSALEGLPPATIRNYFSKISSPAMVAQDVAQDVENDEEDDRFQPQTQGRNGAAESALAASASVPHLMVKPRLRSMVTFNCMNLARPGYIGRFDCILCMDVLPHFSRAQRNALLERLHLYLEPGGYLFLSQTEKLGSTNLNFRSETFDGYTFYRKPLAASAAYGR